MNLADLFRFGALTALLAIVSALGTARSDPVCWNIVRLDEPSARIFAVCPDLPTMSTSEIRESIRQIFAKFGELDGEYSISFFTTKELAVYKDDPSVARAVSSGAWSHGYVGEYDTHSNEVTLWPALPAKRRTLAL